MASFYEVLKTYFLPYYWYFIIAFAFVIFALLAKYGYDNYYAAQSGDAKKFKDVANAEMRDDELDIFFFFVDWCPHCKTAMPDWVKFSNQYDGKTVNGYKVKCISLNCTEETPDVLTAINEYKIEGFPTVKMVKDGKKIEFDAKISYNTLDQFLNTMSAR